jgi:hypothetical protein
MHGGKTAAERQQDQRAREPDGASFDPLAEESVRADGQRRNHDGKGDRIAKLWRDQERGEHFGIGNDEGCDNRAPQTAEATKHNDRERNQKRRPAHIGTYSKKGGVLRHHQGSLPGRSRRRSRIWLERSHHWKSEFVKASSITFAWDILRQGLHVRAD